MQWSLQNLPCWRWLCKAEVKDRHGSALDILDLLLEVMVELLGYEAVLEGFAVVCQRWYLAAACHALCFRDRFETWQRDTLIRLDDLVSQASEPPTENMETLDWPFAIAMEHAEVELRITEFLASPPSVLLVTLLQYGHQLTSLLQWIHLAEDNAGMVSQTHQRQLLNAAVKELGRRASQLATGGREILEHLPDPGLPSRWGQWFETAGQEQGISEGYCERFVQQRGKVSSLWERTRQNMQSAIESYEVIFRISKELKRPDEAQSWSCCGFLPGQGAEASCLGRI